ncbi:MAG TPA: VWA domain-containing protein [Terracidiphilus sp.]|nr:VWA domain-containing protein [Terracidiphilus sp.]
MKPADCPGLRVLVLFALLLAASPALAAQSPTQSAPPPLRVEVNALLIPVVVHDTHDRILDNLAQSDFHVFDDGKERAITGFSVLRAAPNAATDTPPAPRSLVLLFDDRHFSPAGLLDAQKAATQVLDSMLGSEGRAVVLSFNGANSGFTANRQALTQTIESIKSHPTNLNDRTSCPDITYYVADQILNKHSDAQYQIELERAETCSHRSSATDSGYLTILVREAANQALLAGDQDALTSLSFLRNVVHSMSGLPGQKNLILISPGFLNFSDQAMYIESEILSAAAQSGIVISALDERGLVSGVMGANQSGTGSVYSDITGQSISNFSGDTFEGQDVMAELAAGTGGNFLRGGNNLSQQLADLAHGPSTTYLLEVSLKGVKENGKFHRLKIKVDQSGARIQARSGYYAPKKEKKD